MSLYYVKNKGAGYSPTPNIIEPNFTGDGEYFNCGDISSTGIGINSMSISLWFKPREALNNYPIFLQAGGTINNGTRGFYLRYMKDSNTLRTIINDGTNSISSTDVPFDHDEWVHYVIVINRINNHLLAYVNGINKAQDDISHIGNISPVNTLTINHSGNWRYNGLIDDVRIYNRLLSENEIKWMYNMSR